MVEARYPSVHQESGETRGLVHALFTVNIVNIVNMRAEGEYSGVQTSVQTSVETSVKAVQTSVYQRVEGDFKAKKALAPGEG